MIATRAVCSLVAGLALVGFLCQAAPAKEKPSDVGQEVVEDAEHALDDGGHGGHGGSAEVNEDPLEFKKDLALWTGVVFLILFTVLWKFAWGPISKGLAQREKGIADQIAGAEQANLDAKDLLAQYEQKLADSKDEVRGIIEQGRSDAEKVGQEIVDHAKQEAQAENRRALEQIETATAGALKDLADRSATLAVDLAGKIVSAELKPGDHEKLIQRAVSDFAAKPTGKNGSS